MKNDDADVGVVLCIVVLPSDQAQLRRILNNIEQQDYPRKKVAVLLSRTDLKEFDDENSKDVRFYWIDGDSIVKHVYEFLDNDVANYVSFWFHFQWSHPSRLSRKIAEMEQKYKRVSVPIHHMLADLEYSQVLVSARNMEFSAAVWKRSYLLQLGYDGIALALGHTLEVSQDMLYYIAPIATPYLIIKLARDDMSTLASYDGWFTAIPLRDDLSKRICYLLKNESYQPGLSNYLEDFDVKKHFSYTYLRGEVVL